MRQLSFLLSKTKTSKRTHRRRPSTYRPLVSYFSRVAGSTPSTDSEASSAGERAGSQLHRFCLRFWERRCSPASAGVGCVSWAADTISGSPRKTGRTLSAVRSVRGATSGPAALQQHPPRCSPARRGTRRPITGALLRGAPRPPDDMPPSTPASGGGGMEVEMEDEPAPEKAEGWRSRGP